jgi:hypothetical protein
MRPLIAVALALVSVACAPEPPDACLPADAPWVDFDQDGFPASVDCNDSDAMIHPAAFEACDGIDNNCVDGIDEGYPVDDDGFAVCDTEELCDGVDNDFDGRVDEGFPDFDGDDVADCLDNQCATDPSEPGEIPLDEECGTPVIEVRDPWNVRIEWQYTVPSGGGSYVMPAIGNITDDNGDGVIDTRDTPDVVFTSLAGEIIALSGDGGGVIWRFGGVNGLGGISLADVDNDGIPEVIGLTSGGQVVTIRPDGTEKWRSPAISGLQFYPQPAVADLDGDGEIEIVMDVGIVSGTDGRILATLPPTGVSWRTPVIADVDADGISEILLGRHAYRPDGTIKWSVPVSSNGDSCFAAVADIDGDIGGESFWVWGQNMYVVDDDGTLIRTVTLPGAPFRPGPPSVADFDGDGAVEIVVPMNSQIGMFEVDGTLRWTQVMRDFSGIAGVSGYDINGDGAYEATFADEQAFRIYDGRAGTLLYENFSHTSGTVWEYPTIADVDNDGSAEVVIASQGSTWRGVTVFGHAGDGWAEAGPVWPTHDFCVTNVNPDLSIPSPAPLSWTVHNVFRARPVVDALSTDLYVEITDVCVSGCEPGVGVAGVEFRVGNSGGIGVSMDLPLSVFSVDGTTLTKIATVSVPGVEGGTVSATQRVEVPIEAIGPGGLILRIDDDGRDPSELRGRVSECDEENNTTTWPYSVCD